MTSFVREDKQFLRDWSSLKTMCQGNRFVFQNFKNDCINMCTNNEELVELHAKFFTEDFSWKSSSRKSVEAAKQAFSHELDVVYLKCLNENMAVIFDHGKEDVTAWLQSLTRSKLIELMKRVGLKRVKGSDDNKGVFVNLLVLFHIEKRWELDVLQVQVEAENLMTKRAFEKKRVAISKEISKWTTKETSANRSVYRKQFVHDAVKFYDIKYHDQCEKRREQMHARTTGDDIIQNMKSFLEKDSTHTLKMFIERYGFVVFDLPVEVMGQCTEAVIETMTALLKRDGSFLFQKPDPDMVEQEGQEVMFSKTRRMVDLRGTK